MTGRITKQDCYTYNSSYSINEEINTYLLLPHVIISHDIANPISRVGLGWINLKKPNPAPDWVGLGYGLPNLPMGDPWVGWVVGCRWVFRALVRRSRQVSIVIEYSQQCWTLPPVAS